MLQLSPRERQVLDLMLADLGQKEIGRILGIAPITVRNTLARAVARNHARSRTHLLAQYWTEKGEPGAHEKPAVLVPLETWRVITALLATIEPMILPRELTITHRRASILARAVEQRAA